MSADVAVLVAIAVLAVVTVVAAVVAVVAARRIARSVGATVPAPERPRHHDRSSGPVSAQRSTRPDPHPATALEVRPAALEPRVVEGRVVVPPTRDQVVEAALGRPQVRFAVVVQGVVHALRPESRDRIGALVRREYRNRRRDRLRAGRRAARAAHASVTPPAPSDQWLGDR